MSGALTPKAHHDLPFSRPPTPGALPPVIGYVGLGSMGYFMARNITKSRHAHPAGSPPILVYNRTRAKAEKLQKELGESKLRIADSLKQVAEECDIIITCLASDAAAKAVYDEFHGAIKGLNLSKTKIFVDSSTIYPTLTGDIDRLISSTNRAKFIAAPIFGRPAAADAAQLVLILAGDYQSKKEVAYLLVPAMARKVLDLGGNVEKATTFKLIGNSLILGSIDLMGQAFTLSEKSGIESDTLLQLIKDLLPAPPLVGYATKIAHDEFDGKEGFSIEGGIKDASHIHRLAAEHNSPYPAIDTAHQHLITARAIHASQSQPNFETIDWTSGVAGARVAAGLDPFDSKKHSHVEKET